MLFEILSLMGDSRFGGAWIHWQPKNSQGLKPTSIFAAFGTTKVMP
jgi:hypothetical protein